MSDAERNGPFGCYRAFGLTIRSCLALPELPAGEPGEAGPDVTIRFGATPAALEDAEARGVCFQASANRFLLTLDTVGRYLVSEGREIVIERRPAADEGAVRLLLLASAFGALLHQRGVLPLHASAIATTNGAVAFLGDSGTGKSTLAAAFQRRGYRVLCDDIGVVALSSDRRPILYPGYPQIKLWSDALNRLGEEPQNGLRVRDGLEKYGLRLHDAFHADPAPLRRLYILRLTNTEEFALTRLQGGEKFHALMLHTYRRRFLTPNGKPGHFACCVAVGQQTAMSRVVRPRAGFRLNELVDLLERDFAA